MNEDGLLRIDMLRLHKVSWLIRTNRDCAAVERAQVLPYLLKCGTVAGVPTKPESSVWADHSIASPQTLSPIPSLPATPVLHTAASVSTVLSQSPGTPHRHSAMKALVTYPILLASSIAALNCKEVSPESQWHTGKGTRCCPTTWGAGQ